MPRLLAAAILAVGAILAGPAAAQACRPDPMPGTTLYLRGSMSSWAALEEYAFQWHCDAYLLNVDLKGRQEFKVADADWSAATNFGAGPGAELVPGGGNAARSFEGAHTLRLTVSDGRAQLVIGPKTLADVRRREVDDPVARGLAFDSRRGAKQPFGAVPAGTSVRFSVSAAVGRVDALTLVIESRRLEGNQDRLHYTERARVPMTSAAAARGRTWRATYRFADPGVYGYWFEARIGAERYVIQNNNDPVAWTRERGSGGPAAVAFAPGKPAAIRRFRQTVYDPSFRVPAWAQDAVYYQIFPDRFRNGDPSNDPQPGRARYHGGTVELHRHWLDRPWRPGSGDGSDAFHNNDFFGGDLAGIVEKLDELKDLGVNTLYLTPIFRAASNHKYDTADYREVDPAFGRNEDFDRLTREAAKRGMRVIPDASFNHTGSDSIYFDRFGNFGGDGAFAGGRPNPASPYAGWYRFDPTQREPDKQYRFWASADLPELDKASPAFRAFAFGAPDSVTRQWLDRGAAGWRMDVAPWVPDDFWRDWRRAVKQHRPDALTIAETWFDASKYFLGDMFDSTMNYVFRNAVLDYAAGGSALDLVAQLEHLREAYPPQAHRAAMNLIGSHDVARALHVLGWTDERADAAAVARAKQRYRLAVFLQMTQPGAPMVYYGDEVGMTGGEDPDNRGPYPWPDRGGTPDTALRADVARLIHLRHEHAVLRRGSTEAPLHVDRHVVVGLRRLGRTVALVATNNASVEQTVRVAWPRELRGARLTILGASTPATLRAQGAVLQLTLPPVAGMLAIGGPAR